MSMRNYAVTGYGIILNGMLSDDRLEELAEDETIEHQFSFTGDAWALRDDGTENWGDETSFDDESLYFIELPKYPQLCKRAYRNMTECAKDMAKVYRAVRKDVPDLPKLALREIRKKLVSFAGSYYG